MSLEYLRRYRRVYLASPYSKLAPGLDYACDMACIVAARLIRVGVYVFSPIAHGHTIATRGGMDPLDAALWLDQYRTEQEDCDALIIAKLPGWHESDGIKAEFAQAVMLNQPVHYLDPDTMCLTGPE